MPLACAVVPVAHVGFVACDPADQAIASHGPLSSVVSMWASPDLKHGGHWDTGVESMWAKIAAACIRRCCLFRKWCVYMHHAWHGMILHYVISRPHTSVHRWCTCVLGILWFRRPSCGMRSSCVRCILNSRCPIRSRAQIHAPTTGTLAATLQ